MPEGGLSAHSTNAQAADRKNKTTEDQQICEEIKSAVDTFLTEQIVETICEEALNSTLKAAVDAALLHAAYRRDLRRRYRIAFTGRDPPRALRGWEGVRTADSEESGED